MSNNTNGEKLLEVIKSVADFTGGSIEYYKKELYDRVDDKIEIAKDLSMAIFHETGKINPCYNEVCKSCRCVIGRDYPSCTKGLSAFNCLYQMVTPPPNSLDYDGYMPTHQEAINKLHEIGLTDKPRSFYVKNIPIGDDVA